MQSKQPWHEPGCFLKCLVSANACRPLLCVYHSLPLIRILRLRLLQEGFSFFFCLFVCWFVYVVGCLFKKPTVRNHSTVTHRRYPQRSNGVGVTEQPDEHGLAERAAACASLCNVRLPAATSPFLPIVRPQHHSCAIQRADVTTPVNFFFPVLFFFFPSRQGSMRESRAFPWFSWYLLWRRRSSTARRRPFAAGSASIFSWVRIASSCGTPDPGQNCLELRQI